MRIKDIQDEAYLMGQLWSLLRIIDSLNWPKDADKESQILVAQGRANIKKVYMTTFDSYWETQQAAAVKGD